MVKLTRDVDRQLVTNRRGSTAVMPRISILVAAWNEADNIESFIHSYLNLTQAETELILCAGGTDETLLKARAYQGNSIVVLEQEAGNGKQGALRKGFRNATGDIIVLTDADCLLSSESLSKLMEPILSGEFSVTTGISVPKRDQLLHPFVFYQYAMESRGNAAMSGRRNLQALLGRNCAISRAVLEEVGGFDEDVAIGTDSFLAKKILNRGYEIGFIPQSAIESEFATSVRVYCRQRARWTRNAIMHNLKFRQYRRVIRALRGPLVSSMMLVLPLMSIRFRKVTFFPWFALAMYALVVRAKSVHAATNPSAAKPQRVYLKLPLYTLVEWSAMTLGLIQLSLPRTRKRW